MKKCYVRIQHGTFLRNCLSLPEAVSMRSSPSALTLTCEVAQLCRLFATPWTVSLPGSSVHGIFQARVLQWVAISFSRGSSQLRDQSRVSRTTGRRFTIWATREAIDFKDPKTHLSIRFLTCKRKKRNHPSLFLTLMCKKFMGGAGRNED